MPIKFTITDLYVVSDQFEVYDDGALIETTPAVDDWDDLGLASPFTSPPYTTSADTALADGHFSSAVVYFLPGAHSITIRDIHVPPEVGGDPFIDGTVAVKAEELLEVVIDIKPGSFPNSINLRKQGVTPVAVLTTDDFDASTIDPATVRFEGVSPVKWKMQDVKEIWNPGLEVFEGDGDLDLLLHFSTPALAGVLEVTDTEATLVGETTDGALFFGTDSLRIVKGPR